MQVAPEVSELDFSNAITISGFVVPAITTRRVSTMIELADGQSFAIAGLLKDEIRETVDKFPLLGDIPILGALFRSTSFQKNETELVIIVTPHLVKPLDMAKQTLPPTSLLSRMILSSTCSEIRKEKRRLNHLALRNPSKR